MCWCSCPTPTAAGCWCFDNAPGPQALAGLPSSGQGRVLVTSRHRGGYDAFGAELAVDVFDADTARRYLLARSGRTAQEAGDADAVAAALGYLPLALAHAGAYCASATGVPFGEYLELLEDLPSQELFDTSPEVFYQHTVAATWNTSITAAGQRAPLARPALEMTAYLAPEAIPRSFFSVLEENSAAGRKRVADALAALHRYSLATVAGNRISVHRLLQKVIRDRLAGPDQASATADALTATQRAIPEDPELPATWPQWQELVPHVRRPRQHRSRRHPPRRPAAGDTQPDMCIPARGRITLPALDLATQAVAVSSSSSSAPTTPTPSSPRPCPGQPGQLVLVGGAHRRGHRHRRTGRRRLRAPPRPRALDTLTARGNLAVSYWSAGRTGEAIALHEQVAADTERLLGPDHPDTLSARGNLAALVLVGGAHRRGHRHRRSGSPPTASGCWAPTTPTPSPPGPTWPARTGRRGAPARPSPSRSRSPPTPSGCWARTTPTPSTPGATWPARTGRRGAPGRPSPSQERVAADTERLLGPDHPDTLSARGNLAARTGRRGAPARPSPSTNGSPPTPSGSSAPTTPTPSPPGPTWPPRTGRRGAPARPSPSQEQVAADTERLLGPDHPDTLTARANLALSYRSAGRTGEAIALAGTGRRRLRAAARPRPPRHPRRPGQPGRTRTGRRGAPARPSPCTSRSPRTTSGSWAPTTPTPSKPGPTWPPRTGRRGAPGRPSPCRSRSPPTPSGSSARTTPTPSNSGATWPFRTGRRGAPGRPSPCRSRSPPTPSGCSARTTPTPSEPGHRLLDGRRGALGRPSPCRNRSPPPTSGSGPGPPRHPQSPGQPGLLVLVGGAHWGGHRPAGAGRRRHRAAARARTTPTPSEHGPTWPPRTGRRGAPGRPSPCRNRSPPTTSGCSARTTPTRSKPGAIRRR